MSSLPRPEERFINDPLYPRSPFHHVWKRVTSWFFAAMHHHHSLVSFLSNSQRTTTTEEEIVTFLKRLWNRSAGWQFPCRFLKGLLTRTIQRIKGQGTIRPMIEAREAFWFPQLLSASRFSFSNLPSVTTIEFLFRFMAFWPIHARHLRGWGKGKMQEVVDMFYVSSCLALKRSQLIGKNSKRYFSNFNLDSLFLEKFIF